MAATPAVSAQVVNYCTDFLVSTPERAALRVRYLHQHQELREQTGIEARVRAPELCARQLRDYLTLMTGLLHPGEERIALA